MTGASRFFALPNVPTMIEAGFLDYVATAYQGIVAPAGLAGAVTTRINGAIAATLAEPDIVGKLKNIGNVAIPSSTEELKAWVAADIAKWKSIVLDAHLARI